MADISYFDGDTEPQHVAGANLPWSLRFALTEASSAGNLLAQGDRDSIGCPHPGGR